jgi:GTP-binding protein HflX
MIEPKKSDYETAVLIGIINQYQDEEKSKEYLDEIEFLTFTAVG